MGLDPPVPLPDDQALGFFLFHSMRAELKEPSNLQGMATLEEMITKPFFPMGKDGCNSRDYGNRQTKRPPEGGLFGSADSVRIRLRGTRHSSADLYPVSPSFNLRGTSRLVESKNLFHGRNSTSVADATHESTRMRRPAFNQGVPLNRHFKGKLRSKQQDQIHRGCCGGCCGRRSG